MNENQKTSNACSCCGHIFTAQELAEQAHRAESRKKWNDYKDTNKLSGFLYSHTQWCFSLIILAYVVISYFAHQYYVLVLGQQSSGFFTYFAVLGGIAGILITFLDDYAKKRAMTHNQTLFTSFRLQYPKFAAVIEADWLEIWGYNVPIGYER